MQSNPFNPDFNNQQTSTKIVVALERISEAFRVLLWNESKARMLSPIQIQILIFLKYHSAEQRKVSYLAREFNMTKPTISDTIKILEKKALVSREYVFEDSRSFAINLTDEGNLIAEQTAHFAGEIITPVNRLSETEQESLLGHLIGIIHYLNKAGVITLQRMCFTCVNYRKHHKGTEHFCTLMNTPLKNSELRLDCPEHELVVNADF